MSKLDDDLDELSLPPHKPGSTKGRMYSSRFNHAELKRYIKALMLELIDDTMPVPSVASLERLKRKVAEL